MANRKRSLQTKKTNDRREKEILSRVCFRGTISNLLRIFRML